MRGLLELQRTVWISAEALYCERSKLLHVRIVEIDSFPQFLKLTVTILDDFGLRLGVGTSFEIQADWDHLNLALEDWHCPQGPWHIHFNPDLISSIRGVSEKCLSDLPSDDRFQKLHTEYRALLDA